MIFDSDKILTMNTLGFNGESDASSHTSYGSRCAGYNAAL